MLSSAEFAVPRAPRLTSRQHPIVRRFRELAHRREAPPQILLDGAHLIDEALRAGIAIDTVLVATEFLERAPPGDRAVIDRARRAGAAVHETVPAVIDAASPVRSSSGIVAAATWAPASIDDLLASEPALIVGLAGVQDPGNVGAAIRSADGLGATGVIAMDGTAHPGGWKALRGAMGSTFHLPVGVSTTTTALAAVRRQRVRIVAAVADAATPIADLDLTGPVLLLAGNEGAGLPSPVLEQADTRVTIPMRPTLNSLNVSVTVAILLYEARRQRQHP